MKTLKIIDDGKKTTSELMEELKLKFKVFCYRDNLDELFPVPKEKTNRKFPFEQESSDKNKNWIELKKEYGDKMMTFREYILAFQQYNEKTGKYLDEEGWTIFGDEGLPGGLVADGRWGPNCCEVGFDWSDSACRGSRSGARVCISNGTRGIIKENETNTNKKGFSITCKQCGLQINL